MDKNTKKISGEQEVADGAHWNNEELDVKNRARKQAVEFANEIGAEINADDEDSIESFTNDYEIDFQPDGTMAENCHILESVKPEFRYDYVLKEMLAAFLEEETAKNALENRGKEFASNFSRNSFTSNDLNTVLGYALHENDGSAMWMLGAKVGGERQLYYRDPINFKGGEWQKSTADEFFKFAGDFYVHNYQKEFDEKHLSMMRELFPNSKDIEKLWEQNFTKDDMQPDDVKAIADHSAHGKIWSHLQDIEDDHDSPIITLEHAITEAENYADELNKKDFGNRPDSTEDEKNIRNEFLSLLKNVNDVLHSDEFLDNTFLIDNATADNLDLLHAEVLKNCAELAKEDFLSSFGEIIDGKYPNQEEAEYRRRTLNDLRVDVKNLDNYLDDNASRLLENVYETARHKSVELYDFIEATVDTSNLTAEQEMEWNHALEKLLNGYTDYKEFNEKWDVSLVPTTAKLHWLESEKDLIHIALDHAFGNDNVEVPYGAESYKDFLDSIDFEKRFSRSNLLRANTLQMNNEKLQEKNIAENKDMERFSAIFAGMKTLDLHGEPKNIEGLIENYRNTKGVKLPVIEAISTMLYDSPQIHENGSYDNFGVLSVKNFDERYKQDGTEVRNELCDMVAEKIVADKSINNIEQVKELLKIDSKKILKEKLDEITHSEEFVRKFGDWEKSNRIEKLKKSESLQISGKIIIHEKDETSYINELRNNPSRENLRKLTNIVSDFGKEMLQNLRFEQNLDNYASPILTINDDGKKYHINFSGIKETGHHNLYQKGHIEGIYNIPQIVESAIYLTTEKNEDNHKPELKQFHYYSLGIKLDNDDYTAKIVFTENKNGEIYYDQSLSTIEKGKLIDLIQQKNKPIAVNPINRRDSNELSENEPPSTYYDKRLINICQVPQMPYLEMVNGKWQPKEEAIQAVKEGKLFIEKTGQGYTMHDEKSPSIEQNDDYIHSEEFISKFGDWEKANRIEKLKQAETLVGNSKITVLGNDITDLVERLRTEYSVSNLKQLQNIAKDIGKEVISEYRKKQKLDEYSNPEFKNIDIGENYKLQWTGIKEIKGHNIFQKGHIEAIRAIPEIIEKGIYIGKEPNEDGRNPNLKEFYYFASGLKIDSDDYTVKSVFVKNDKGQIFYDQSLSSIEKGKFVDIIQEKNKPETVNLVNTKDSFELLENKSPSTYYDKRLINICQVPQMPYLEMVNGKWRPTQKVIKAVEDGKLFLEKNRQTYIMHDESFLEEKTVENEERELSKEEFDRLSNLLGNATDSEGQDFKAKFDAKNQDTKQIVATLLHETREPEEAYALSPSYFDFESEEKDGDGYDMRWDLYENIATKILSDKAIISMEQVENLIEEESFRLEEKYNKEHNITQKQEYQKEEQHEQEWPGLATWKELADVVGKDIYVYKDDVLENNEGISERKWKTEALARILNDGILDLRGFDTESTSKINSLQYDNDFMKTIKGEVYKAINPEKWDVLTKLAEDTVDEYSPEIVGLTVDTLQIRYDEKLSEDHVYLEAVEKGLVEIDKNMAERILDNNNPRLLEDGVKIAIVKASFEKDTPEWERPERFIVTPHNSFAENYIDKELADYLTDNRINSTEPKISEKQAGIISYYLMRNEYALYTDKKGNLNCVDFSEDFNTENIDVITNKDLLKLTMDLINKDIGFKDRAEEDLKEIQAVFNDYEQTQKIQQTQSVQELYDSFIGNVEKEFKELKLLRAATINTIKTLLPEDKKIINEELKKRGAKTPESLALVVKESIEKRNKNKTRKQSQNKEKDYFERER